MHKKKSATEVLKYLIYILEANLAELSAVKHKDAYTLGSWEANIECIEVIKCWTRAKAYGLDYDPETKYVLFNRETAQCLCPPTKKPRRKK